MVKLGPLVTCDLVSYQKKNGLYFIDSEQSLLLYVNERAVSVSVGPGFTWEVTAPKWVDWVFPTDELIRPALWHDALYHCRGGMLQDERVRTLPTDVRISRSGVDMIFMLLCRYYGLDQLHSWIAYSAVRMFGKRMWRE